ncbi:MAG: hypothetical protein AAFX50_01735, partial [Acidobacteriota bacterium]
NSNVGNIHAQFVDPVSGPSWAAGGITVSDAADWQGLPDVVSNGECPAKVSFTDYRTDGDATMQRIVCPGIAGFVLVEAAFQELQVAGTGLVDIFGSIDEAHADSAGFTLTFDPGVVDVVDVVSGTLKGLETRIDRDAGTVTVDARGGRLDRDRPLFSLKLRGRDEGASALSFTRAELNRDASVGGAATVVRVGRR